MNEVIEVQEPVSDAMEEVQRELENLIMRDVTDESNEEKEKRPDGTESRLSEEGEHEGEDETGNEEEDEEGEEGEDEGEEGEENELILNVPGSEEIPTLAQDEKEEEEENDGGGEWITPENVHIHKAASYGQTLDNKRRKWPMIMKVACMTADYAMQVSAWREFKNVVFIDRTIVLWLRDVDAVAYTFFFFFLSPERVAADATQSPLDRRLAYQAY